MTAFHQTDEDGVFAGHKPKEDFGNTNYSDYRIVDGFKLVKHKKPEWIVCLELLRYV